MTKARTNADNVTADIAGITAGTGITGGGASGTVTITNDMATTIAAAGDLIYGTANDAYSALSLGTAGQLLKVNSGATAPEWGAAPESGGMTLISTTTLAGTTTISSIPTTYNDLQIEIFRTKNSGGNYDLVCFPNNQTTSTDFFSNRATTSTMTFVQDDYIRFTGTTTAMANDQTNAWTLIIHNYASATARKPFTISGGYYNNGKFVLMTTGLIRDTSAITSLVINGAGSSDSGTVLLYGVK